MCECQWQTIDTIPRDGRVVLLWVSAVRYGEDDDGRPFEQDCSVVDFGQWCALLDDGDGYADAYGAPHGDAQHVTHWMPLPAAPAISTLTKPAHPKPMTQAELDALSYWVRAGRPPEEPKS